tara:strand:+ start:232 stop:432 length:201 start_codon:yes stop_codon:yes gene_type:complete
MKNYLEAILDLITLVWFGERVPGEPIKQPTFKTTVPEDRPSENEWMKMFRVSSLHGVNQKIFFESK